MRRKDGTRRRFGAGALVLTALITLAVTLAAVAGAVWTVLGREGVALLQGLTVVNTCFVGEYEQAEVTDAALTGMIQGLGDRWSYIWTRSAMLRSRSAGPTPMWALASP